MTRSLLYREAGEVCFDWGPCNGPTYCGPVLYPVWAVLETWNTFPFFPCFLWSMLPMDLRRRSGGEVLGWQRQAQAAWLGLESWPPRHAVAQRQPWWGPGLSGNAWQLALITLISSGGSMPWASAPVLSGPFPSLSAQSKGSWEDTPADGPINMKSSRFCSDTTLMLLPSTSKKQDSSRLRCKQYILHTYTCDC